MGKETINLDTHGKSSGRGGNYSTNYQISGREMMTPDEVRRLDNRYAILFIRGEKPIIDLKYDILKHPNVAYTTDGKGKTYIHGNTEKSIATISIAEEMQEYEIYKLEEIDEYEIFTEEEIEEMILKEAI